MPATTYYYMRQRNGAEVWIVPGDTGWNDAAEVWHSTDELEGATDKQLASLGVERCTVEGEAAVPFFEIEVFEAEGTSIIRRGEPVPVEIIKGKLYDLAVAKLPPKTAPEPDLEAELAIIAKAVSVEDLKPVKERLETKAAPEKLAEFKMVSAFEVDG